jgi:hypothetical protein
LILSTTRSALAALTAFGYWQGDKQLSLHLFVL